MNEYRCGECGVGFRGFPFQLFPKIIEHHKAECVGGEGDDTQS